MASYKLSASITGVEQSATGLHIIQIAAGEVLTFPGNAGESGLVELIFKGRNVTVFAQDLHQRGSRIEDGGETYPSS